MFDLKKYPNAVMVVRFVVWIIVLVGVSGGFWFAINRFTNKETFVVNPNIAAAYPQQLDENDPSATAAGTIEIRSHPQNVMSGMSWKPTQSIESGEPSTYIETPVLEDTTPYNLSQDY